MKPTHRRNSKLIVLIISVVFFVSVNSYSQSGQKYCVDGNNLSANDRFGSNNYADVNIFTNSKKRATFTKDGLFDVLGQSRFRKNSIFDSLLTAFSIQTQTLQTDALAVINNGQIGGILTIGATLTFDGTNNKIISSTGVIDFGNNTLSTSGNFSATNINANHITSQAVQTNYLVSDSINTQVINAQKFLLNGAGLTQSPWITTTYGIVIDPAVQNKDVYMNRLFVQEAVNIGNFRFSNGGSVVPPAPIIKDTIASQYEIVLRSTAEKLQLAANEVSVQQQLGVGKTPGAGVALDVAGDIRSTGNITSSTLTTTSIQTSQLAISDKLESDTIHARKEFLVNSSLKVAKETTNSFAEVSTVDTAVTLVLQKEEAAQVVIGPAPVTPVPTLPGQVKDKLTVIGNTLLQGDVNVSGNITTAGNITTNSINANNMNVSYTDFDSLHVQNRIKVGNSIVLESLTGTTGPENHIYTTDGSGSLFIQSQGYNQNTIINAGNIGNVGIGTTSPPETKLHIENYGNVRITLKDASNPTGKYFQIEQDGDLVSFNDDGVKQIISMKLTSGNVGIGTLDPQAKLHISGPGDQNIDISTTDALGSYMRLMAVTSNGETESQLQFRGKMRFVKPLGMEGGITRMVIDENGKVGIGTNPSQTLDVEGTMRISSLYGTGTRMVVTDANGNLSAQSMPAGADNLGNHTATQNIKLNDKYLSNNGTGGIRISNSGKVGINTIPSTSDDLKVSGTSYFASPIGILVAPDPFLALKTNGNCVLTGYVGIDGAQDQSLTYKLKVYGSALASGGTWVDSDKRYKKDIKELENPLDKIMKLNGVQYAFNKEKFSEKDFNDGNNIGFIAQDVIEILPEVVKQDGDGYYAINYDAVTPVLVEAVKAQQAIIEKLSKQIEGLQNSISESSNISNFSNSSLQSTEKKQEDGIILFQNKPNPFSETTIIQYKLPATINEASLIVFDMQGKLLKKYENLQKGEGSVAINGGELYAGMFIYTLIVDGKEADSKRMILTK